MTDEETIGNTINIKTLGKENCKLRIGADALDLMAHRVTEMVISMWAAAEVAATGDGMGTIKAQHLMSKTSEEATMDTVDLVAMNIRTIQKDIEEIRGALRGTKK